MKISLSSTAIGIYAAFVPLLLAGCNGGSSGSTSLEPAPSIGVFIDSPVEGLNYKTQSTSGRTNSAGQFEFYPGETIIFSIGGITFEPTTAEIELSPLSIVKTTDFDDDEALNIARFLQSLDADGNPDNGIKINELAHTIAQDMTLDFTSDFDNSDQVRDLIAAANPQYPDLVDREDAKNHLMYSLSLIHISEPTRPY